MQFIHVIVTPVYCHMIQKSFYADLLLKKTFLIIIINVGIEKQLCCFMF